MPHYYRNVTGLGNVAISRHAQDRMREESISYAMMEDALQDGDTVPDGQAIVWREKNNVRVVIVRRPEPFSGAMLATTIYRIKGAA